MIWWGAQYDGNYTGIPPRLGEEEKEIWKRWAPTALKNALKIWFDVGLGEGRPMPKNIPENIQKMWLRNTQKRADVIIEKQNWIWIVEIRAKANSNVVGRLLQYELLWRKEKVSEKPTKLIIVTDMLDLDLQKLAESLNIAYILV